jgi:hypothetical protein
MFMVSDEQLRQTDVLIIRKGKGAAAVFRNGEIADQYEALVIGHATRTPIQIKVLRVAVKTEEEFYDVSGRFRRIHKGPWRT